MSYWDENYDFGPLNYGVDDGFAENYDFGGFDPVSYLDVMQNYGQQYYDPTEQLNMSAFTVPEPTFQDKVMSYIQEAVGGAADTAGSLGKNLGREFSANPLAALGTLGGGAMALAGLMQNQSKVRVPEMSGEQKALQNLIMQQAQTMGEEGDVATAYKQRVLKALGGDDSADPTLLREQEEERRLMETRLLRELGPGYLTSGSDDRLGGKILNDLNKRQSEARFTNRRQMLTQDEQSRQGAAGLDLQKKSTAGNLALQGFSGLGDYAKMGLQAKMANVQTDAQRASDLVRGGSQLLGYSVGNMKSSPFDKYWEKQIQKNTTKGY